MADKAKATGPVYRDEAADLMAAAARGPSRPAPPDIELTARRATPVVRAEAERRLPYPEPVGFNDNTDDDTDDLPAAPAPRAQKRRSPLQIAARIIIAPLYAVMAVAAVGIIGLFVKGLF